MIQGDMMKYIKSTLIAALTAVATHVPAEAKFAAPFWLSQAGQQAYYPQVGVDANGDAVFAWELTSSSHNIQARTRSAAGILNPLLTFSDAPDANGPPVVAVDTSGDAVFAWQSQVGLPYWIQARSLSAAGVLGKVRDLSGTHGDAPEVAIDANGNGVLAGSAGMERPTSSSFALSRLPALWGHSRTSPMLGSIRRLPSLRLRRMAAVW